MLRPFVHQQSQMLKDFGDLLESSLWKLKNDIALIVKKKKEYLLHIKQWGCIKRNLQTLALQVVKITLWRQWGLIHPLNLVLPFLMETFLQCDFKSYESETTHSMKVKWEPRGKWLPDWALGSAPRVKSWLSASFINLKIWGNWLPFSL